MRPPNLVVIACGLQHGRSMRVKTRICVSRHLYLLRLVREAYHEWDASVGGVCMDRETQVAIIGAGPVGLCLALDLAWRGIQVTIVEQRPAGEPPSVKCNH